MIGVEKGNVMNPFTILTILMSIEAVAGVITIILLLGAAKAWLDVPEAAKKKRRLEEFDRIITDLGNSFK
jgi:hypothetical protein